MAQRGVEQATVRIIGAPSGHFPYFCQLGQVLLNLWKKKRRDNASQYPDFDRYSNTGVECLLFPQLNSIFPQQMKMLKLVKQIPYNSGKWTKRFRGTVRLTFYDLFIGCAVRLVYVRQD